MSAVGRRLACKTLGLEWCHRRKPGERFAKSPTVLDLMRPLLPWEAVLEETTGSASGSASKVMHVGS